MKTPSYTKQVSRAGSRGASWVLATGMVVAIAACSSVEYIGGKKQDQRTAASANDSENAIPPGSSPSSRDAEAADGQEAGSTATGSGTGGGGDGESAGAADQGSGGDADDGLGGDDQGGDAGDDGGPAEPLAITSEPEISGRIGDAYAYQVILTGAQGKTVRYVLEKAPTGMSIDQNGLLRWTPSAQQKGSAQVILRVENANDPGDAVGQSFQILVHAHLKIISSAPSATQEGRTYTYLVEVENGEGKTIRYELTQAPAGMSISPTGLISWQPNESQIGMNDVRVRAQNVNLAADSDEQAFSVQVLGYRLMIISDPPSSLPHGGQLDYQLVLLNHRGKTVAYEVSGPKGAAISSTGRLSWTATETGTFEFTVRALNVNDAKDRTLQTFSVKVTPVCSTEHRLSVWVESAAGGTLRRFVADVVAFAGRDDPARNYNYNGKVGPHNFSGVPKIGSTPEGYKTKVFLYEGAGSGLSFNFIHNIDNGGARDNVVHWDLAVTGNEGKDRILLSDDPSETRSCQSTKHISGCPRGGPGKSYYLARHHYWKNTDGGVIGPLAGPSWEVRADVLTQGSSRNNNIIFDSADGRSFALGQYAHRGSVKAIVVAPREVRVCSSDVPTPRPSRAPGKGL